MMKRNVCLFIAFIIFQCWVSFVSADPVNIKPVNDIPESLTLQQAIDFALKNNTDVKTQEEAIRIARAQYIQKRSSILPQVNLTVESEHLNNAGATVSDGNTGNEIFSMMEVSQPVFSFGKLSQGIAIYQYAIQIQELKLEESKQSVIYQIASAFYDILLQEELVKVNEDALKTAEEHLQVAQLRFEQGINTQFDVTRAKVDIANRRPDLISARNELLKARQSLNQILNLPSNTVIKIDGKLNYLEYNPDSQKAWNIALENRPGLKSQKLTIQQNETNFHLRKALYTPNIYVGGDYTLVHSKFQGHDSFDSQSWTGYVKLTMPIFDGLNISGQIKEAKAALEQAKLSYEKTLLSAQTEVEQTILEIKKQKELVDATKEAIDLAQLSLSMAQLSYENGKATTLDVTDAELSLTTARSNWAKAIHDYLVALATLKKALGVNELSS